MQGALMRISKWAWIFAIIVVVFYVVFAMLARGDEATLHVLAQECARALVGTMAICVLSRLIADGLRRK